MRTLELGGAIDAATFLTDEEAAVAVGGTIWKIATRAQRPHAVPSEWYAPASSQARPSSAQTVSAKAAAAAAADKAKAQANVVEGRHAAGDEAARLAVRGRIAGAVDDAKAQWSADVGVSGLKRVVHGLPFHRRATDDVALKKLRATYSTLDEVEHVRAQAEEAAAMAEAAASLSESPTGSPTGRGGRFASFDDSPPTSPAARAERRASAKRGSVGTVKEEEEGDEAEDSDDEIKSLPSALSTPAEGGGDRFGRLAVRTGAGGDDTMSPWKLNDGGGNDAAASGGAAGGRGGAASGHDAVAAQRSQRNKKSRRVSAMVDIVLGVIRLNGDGVVESPPPTKETGGLPKAVLQALESAKEAAKTLKRPPGADEALNEARYANEQVKYRRAAFAQPLWAPKYPAGHSGRGPPPALALRDDVEAKLAEAAGGGASAKGGGSAAAGRWAARAQTSASWCRRSASWLRRTARAAAAGAASAPHSRVIATATCAPSGGAWRTARWARSTSSTPISSTSSRQGTRLTT